MTSILKKYRQFIIGLVVGSVIMCGIPTFAAVTNITAKLGTSKYIINGQPIVLDTVTYKSTSYTNTKKIIKAIGGDMTVNNTDNTTVINTNQNEPVGEDVSSNTATAVQDTPNTPTTTDSQNNIINTDSEIDKSILLVYNKSKYIPLDYLQNYCKQNGYELRFDLGISKYAQLYSSNGTYKHEYVLPVQINDKYYIALNAYDIFLKEVIDHHL